MDNMDLSDLVDRYERMLISGQEQYFDADEYDCLAEYYDRTDNLDKAREVVEAGLRIHPDHELLLLKNARFLIYDGMYLDAVEYMNIHFSDYDYDLFFLKIECCLYLGLRGEAYELTKTILEDEEMDPEVTLSELGFLYLEADYVNEGILYLEKSLEYNPDNKEVLADLAFAYEDSGDFEKAINVTDRLLDIDPYNSDFWLFLGKIYIQTENYQKAIDAFDFVCTIEGEDVSYLKLKAHCLVLVDRIQEAIDLLIHCIESAPFDEYLYVSLIDCYLSVEKYDAILSLIDRFDSDLDDQSSILLAKKAYAYSMMNDSYNSLHYIAEAISKDPYVYEINLIAIDIFSKYSMPAEALMVCSKILLDRNDDMDVLEKAVALSVRIGDFGQALELQKQICSLSETTEAKHKLALLYLENGNKDEYVACINSFDINSLEAFFHLFYDEDFFDKSMLNAEFMISYLKEAYNSRTLYKVMKY